jgi:ferredoxin/flavodoxin---NADP+ reductase
MGTMFKIVKRKEMAEKTIILNEIEAPRIALKVQPGQFVILRSMETGERIPLTVADFDRKKGTITVIYATVGRSTILFGEMKEGDCYQNVVGPLGKPTHVEKVGTAVCVGGGTGTAVLYPIARKLKQLSNKVITIIGARSKDRLILLDELRAVSDEVLICTDDGSLGHHGVTIELLEEVLEREKVDLTVAIGPVIMMDLACKSTKPYGINTLVSLNPIMIDGTGMCGSCRVVVGGETKYACVDGPEFDGHMVDFASLTNRLQAYKDEEKESLEFHSNRIEEPHKCRMEVVPMGEIEVSPNEIEASPIEGE